MATCLCFLPERAVPSFQPEAKVEVCAHSLHTSFRGEIDAWAKPHLQTPAIVWELHTSSKRRYLRHELQVLRTQGTSRAANPHQHPIDITNA